MYGISTIFCTNFHKLLGIGTIFAADDDHFIYGFGQFFRFCLPFFRCGTDGVVNFYIDASVLQNFQNLVEFCLTECGLHHNSISVFFGNFFCFCRFFICLIFRTSFRNNTLLFIFKKFLLNPVKKVIAERKAKADSQIADAAKLRTEAEAMKAEYEQNLQNARAEANQIVARAQKTATARGEEIVGEARAQAAALKQKAEADIAQERKKAVNEAKDEIGGMAMEIASKVVEREIKEADHKDLIDEFIKNVGEAS